MARKLRIQYPGSIYHVMNRGDHQELIFSDCYPLYQSDACPRPPWLRVDRLLGEWGIRWDQPGAGREFSALMEARRQAELEQEFKPLPRGWCVGSEAFRAEMLQYIEEQRGKWHYGAELSESAQAKAERLIAEALRAGGVAEGQVATWRKGHPFKVNLAAKLRAETTVTVSWIAQRLAMGTRGHLAHLLYRKGGSPPTPSQFRQPTLNI